MMSHGATLARIQTISGRVLLSRLWNSDKVAEVSHRNMPFSLAIA
jgi:hypothetical protein